MAENNSPAAVATPKDVSVRILKKRESDRRCQRIKRERTKSKIAALEEKVRDLGNQDSSGQVQLLMHQLEVSERERGRLARAMKSIQTVLHEADPSDTGDTGDTKPNVVLRNASPSTARSSDYSQSHYGISYPTDQQATAVFNLPLYHTTVSEPTSSLADVAEDPITMPILMPSDPGKYAQQSQTSQSDEVLAVDDSNGKQDDFNAWQFTHEMLSTSFQWPTYYQMLQDHFREDTPVRAVVEGWEAVEGNSIIHPSWHILRKLDSVLLSAVHPRERLAANYAVYLLLMSHTCPERRSELPSYYHSRPSQNLADNYAIHCFPWPGLRERFIFSPHRYRNNNFFETIVSGLRMRWPYEFRDCYKKNMETGLYSITREFIECIMDIRCWALTEEVFRKWPELRADAPGFDSIPGSVSNMIHPPRPGKASFQSARRNIGQHQPRPMAASLPLQHAPYVNVYLQSATISATSDQSRLDTYQTSEEMAPPFWVYNSGAQPAHGSRGQMASATITANTEAVSSFR